MVKAIIRRQAKEGARILPLLRQIRISAMHFPGYISGETLVNTEDSSVIVVITTWDSLRAWKGWEKSVERSKLSSNSSRSWCNHRVPRLIATSLMRKPPNRADKEKG